jgi:hypothetical protein
MKTDEPHIAIGSDRLITVPKELRNIAVQYDHNIETVTFDCPRYWDDNDMSNMTVNINFVRSDGHEGTYICKEVTIDAADPDVIHFNWTISREVTEVSGKLTVIVCIKKDNAGGITSQVWHSQRCETFSVLPGLLCDSVTIPSDPEYNGVQVDYNQNDELAADYIKNRPFYINTQTYAFTEDDYKTPVCSFSMSGDEENPQMVGIYKLSDIPIPLKQINDTTSSLRSAIEVDGEIERFYDIPWWLNTDGNSSYPGDSEQHFELYAMDATGDVAEDIYKDTVMAIDIILNNVVVVYKDVNMQELIGVDVTLTPGVYTIFSRDEESGEYYMFDDITTVELKQIEKEFLPEMGLNEEQVEVIVEEKISSSILSVLGGAS